MLLYVIRHADPIYDPDSLTKKGHLQAQALAKRLSVHGLDEIYCSPNLRARQTAQPTCDLLGIEMKIEPWTSEDIAWGEMACHTLEGNYGWPFQIQNSKVKNDENLALKDKWYEAKCFENVDIKAGFDRIAFESDKFTEKLGYRREGAIYRAVSPSEKRIAVFCHQGFGTTWLSYLLSINPLLFWSSFDISHSSVTIIQFKNTDDALVAPKCLCLSDLSHIYGDRLPLCYENEIDI